MIDEVWTEVLGYEGYYEVSNEGRVRRTSTGRIRKRVIGTKGYLQVTLSRDNKARTFNVHQLVMLAFVGPCPIGMEVCHNDGNQAHARLSNLRYDTHSANMLDKRRHGTASVNAGEANNGSKLTDDDIRFIRAYPEHKRWRHQLADHFGVSPNTISTVRHSTWQHIEHPILDPYDATARGDRNGKAKLAEADIPTIRKRISCGEKYSEIARDFGVGYQAIYSIASGRTWSQVD